MKLHVSAQLRHNRYGFEARSPELKLTGQGAHEQEAIESLRRGVMAWCGGLEVLGKLEQTITHKGLKCDPEGDSVTVEIEAEC